MLKELHLTLQYKVPALLAVGLEGFWGLVICAIALPVLSNVKGDDGRSLDSFRGAIRVCILKEAPRPFQQL